MGNLLDTGSGLRILVKTLRGLLRLLRHAEERVLEHLIHHPVHLIHHAEHLGKRVTTWKHPAGYEERLG
jgi:hypothetical protein